MYKILRNNLNQGDERLVLCKLINKLKKKQMEKHPMLINHKTIY